jgi:hypothetical protein
MHIAAFDCRIAAMRKSPDESGNSAIGNRQ